MSTTIGCPIPGVSQPKEPVRLIDANETMEALNRAEIELYPSEYKAFQKAIDEIPTIDPESLRPTAHWIKCDLVEVEHGECTRYPYFAKLFLRQ